MDPDRQYLGRWLLSDQLLVAKRRSSLTLFAWYFPADNSLQVSLAPFRVHIYNNVRRIAACGRKVGIITTEDEIFIWTVGGTLVKIDTAQNPSAFLALQPPNDTTMVSNWSPIGMVLVPGNNNGFFVFNLQSVIETFPESERRIIRVYLQVQSHQADENQETFSKQMYSDDSISESIHGNWYDPPVPLRAYSTLCCMKSIDSDGNFVFICDTKLPVS